MILKYEVIKNGNVVHSGGASSEAEIHEQLKPYYDHKTFGNPEISELKELQDVLITPAVLDPETGEEIEPAVYEQREVVVRPHSPAEYEIVITDITEEIERQSKLEADISRGESIKSRCEKAISLIISYNSDFSFEEIDQLESDFGEIYNFLMKRRIDKAYFLLNSAQPTELITQEFLNQLKSVLIG